MTERRPARTLTLGFGRTARRWGAALLLLTVPACLRRPIPNPQVLVVAIQSAPNNLDPRMGTDDASQKIDDLIFDTLMTLDDQMRLRPKLAERLDRADPATYVATLRRGVLFHDGH